MPTCRTSLLGIKLVYCEGDDRKEVWVDLKKVHALAWCDEEVGAKGKGQGGNSKLPTDNNGPGNCDDADIAGTAPPPPVCWWNGTEWVCGDEN